MNSRVDASEIVVSTPLRTAIGTFGGALKETPATDLGAFEAGGTATVSPGQLQFTAGAYSMNEAAGTMTISVARTGGSDGAVSVQYASSNGTATATRAGFGRTRSLSRRG